MNSIRIIRLVFAALALAGCAEKIATVKQTSPRFASVGTQKSELGVAERQLHDAQKLEHREPTRALGGYLASAKIASDQLNRQPGDARARDLYDFAVARCVAVIERAPLDPWNHSLSVPGPDGEYVLTTLRHPGAGRNPADYNIIPADTLAIGGEWKCADCSQGTGEDSQDRLGQCGLGTEPMGRRDRQVAEKRSRKRSTR